MNPVFTHQQIKVSNAWNCILSLCLPREFVQQAVAQFKCLAAIHQSSALPIAICPRIVENIGQFRCLLP
jgi:hypothetical protein